MKKLSIIIPVYNVQGFLQDCLESIITSKKKFEIILVDDGSNDNSSKICDEYAKKDKRILSYHKKNGGVSSARNFGLKKATGNYITFVDSDDVLSNQWDKILNYIKDDDIYYYNSKVKDILNKNDLLRYITGANKKHIYMSSVYSKIFKKEFLINNNIFFNEKLINGEDMLFNIEAAILAKTFEIINFHYYFYRQAIGQATRKFDGKIFDSDRIFHQNLSFLFKKHKINDFVSKEIRESCLINAVILILNRISYIKNFNEAKDKFDFLNSNPYIEIIKSKNNFFTVSLLFKLCRLKKYMLVYYYLKFRNKVSLLLKYNKKVRFAEI